MLPEFIRQRSLISVNDADKLLEYFEKHGLDQRKDEVNINIICFS